MVLAAVAPLRASAQGIEPSWRVGVEWSAGKQRFQPFWDDPNYNHDVKGYKLLLNRQLSSRSLPPGGTAEWELQIEPSYYVARHRLLNQYFIGPNWGSDYLEERARLTKGLTVREYVVNVGIVGRRDPTKWLSFFFLASIGPAWVDPGTERLARGFTFSDILGAGVGLRIGRCLFEVHPGLRHVSNLYTQKPNHGYNSATLDLALSFGP
jgi:hypothetical protein